MSADAPQNALLAMRQLIDAICMTTTTGARMHTTWVTSAVAPVDHAVTDDAMATGMAARGEFVAVCGAQFFSAPMAADPGPVCANCRRFVVARASLRSVEQRMARRRVRRHGLPDALARLVAAVCGSESPAAPGPRAMAGTAADAVSPAGAAGPSSRRDRGEDVGPSVPRSRRVPPGESVAGGGVW